MTKQLLKKTAMILLSAVMLCACSKPGEKGEKGDKGDKGEQGATGATGAQGAQGIQGERGERGLQGERGERGLQGEQGIQGIQGEQGIQGIQGIPGVAGNANVMMYTYGYKYIPVGDYADYIIPISFADAGKCLIYAYALSIYGYWYPIPGLANGFETRFVLVDESPNTVINIYLYSIPATAVLTFPVEWNAFRIIVVPITNIIPKGAVDYSNYNEVAKYYGLPE